MSNLYCLRCKMFENKNPTISQKDIGITMISANCVMFYSNKQKLL